MCTNLGIDVDADISKSESLERYVCARVDGYEYARADTVDERR